MQKYSDHVPTCFDSHIAIDGREHWLLAPVSQTRDSGELDQSNFAVALEMLGGESETVEVHRFGHWGPGWYEIIIVDPADTARVSILETIADRLENYPVLDEDDYSNREWDSFVDQWQAYGASDFRKACVGAFGLGDAAESRLDDIDDGELREWWSNHAPEPYTHDSSGVVISVRWIEESSGMNRAQMAEVLRLAR